MNTLTYIGKCPRKGCQCVLRVTIPAVPVKRTVGRGIYRREVVELQAVEHPCYGMSQCREHRRYVIWERIEGKVSEHVCDARCTSAKGHNCECSCGGANHGKDWDVTLGL